MRRRVACSDSCTKDLSIESGLLVGGVVVVLIVASVTGWILARRAGSPEYRATIANLNARTRAWWVMVAIFLLAMISGGIGSVVLFGLTSFLALREFVTMTPTKRSDHSTLLCRRQLRINGQRQHFATRLLGNW